jgi:PTH1 family peptidyl-tRNA hydrolase
VHLVLGLGNPGRRYEQTRHNAGFLVVDRLAERAGAAVDRRQLGALVANLQLDGQAGAEGPRVSPLRGPLGPHPVVLAKPQSFMNLSGQPAASLRGFYKVPLEQVIVVHDDVDLPFGDVRVKLGGGHGGHNGLRDLAGKLGGGFLRVRFGVGRPPEGWNTADYVLGSFTSDEQPALPEIVDVAADAVSMVVAQGVTAAMNRFNTRRPPEPASDAPSKGPSPGSDAPR